MIKGRIIEKQEHNKMVIVTDRMNASVSGEKRAK